MADRGHFFLNQRKLREEIRSSYNAAVYLAILRTASEAVGSAAKRNQKKLNQANQYK